MDEEGIKPKLSLSEKDIFFKRIQRYISSAEEELLVISPYVRTDVFRKLLVSECGAKKITVITTWKLRDLQFGSSDLDLYEFCKDNQIYLYLNQRIHMKAFINDYSSCLFGSANISNRGMALVDNYNYELATEIVELDVRDTIYLKKILKEATLITDELYDTYKNALANLAPAPEADEPEISLIQPRSEFLISTLPMSRDIHKLFTFYSNNFESISEEEKQCAIHDVVLYDIPPYLTKEKFITLLKERFFNSKFIAKLLDFVEDRKYFGEIKAWIQENCEDVPVPSRRDLTGNVQVLYKWIVDLSDGKYLMGRPHHSQKLYKTD